MFCFISKKEYNALVACTKIISDKVNTLDNHLSLIKTAIEGDISDIRAKLGVAHSQIESSREERLSLANAQNSLSSRIIDIEADVGNLRMSTSLEDVATRSNCAEAIEALNGTLSSKLDELELTFDNELDLVNADLNLLKETVKALDKPATPKKPPVKKKA